MLLKLGVGVGLAGGVAAGAALAANAVTSNTPAQPASSLASGTSGSGSSGGSTPATPPAGPRGAGGFGPGMRIGGRVLHGQATVQGPNGYETVDQRTGTVASLTNTSGSTWSLTVKSADGTSGTFTVDPGTSVNGGEAGISSVKQGDTVSVIAVESNGTVTAKMLVDRTVLGQNGSSWMPRRISPSGPSPSGPSPSGPSPSSPSPSSPSPSSPSPSS